MNNTCGYVYVREHPSYDTNNACKIGKTLNIPDRDTQYATGELNRGRFVEVFEMSDKIYGNVEKILQREFSKFNIKYNAGTEFYDKKVIDMIEPVLLKDAIKYKKLSPTEIHDLLRVNRVREIVKRLNISNLISVLHKIKIPIYLPRDDQLTIINTTNTHFSKYNKGILVLPCGVGKTLISLWTTQKMQSKRLLIGVPNKLLLKQWGNDVAKVFCNNELYLNVSGGTTVEDIQQFMEDNANTKSILITTYSSAHKVRTASENASFVFDMKILDEAHHLTSMNNNVEENTKHYVEILKIEAYKQLSLTATLKHIQSTAETIVSNDMIEFFGEIIVQKSLLWAINKKIVCDYAIYTVHTDEEKFEEALTQLNITDCNDKTLLLSAFATLKAISCKDMHHPLIYVNNQKNALKVQKFIEMLLNEGYFDLKELYYSDYHSKMKSKEQKRILGKFTTSQTAVITCVYCLGEGWDNPSVDGVVFAENMTSNIRIVQSALRAIRINKNEPAKKAKIIIPVINTPNLIDSTENASFKTVREVIHLLGLEDETVSQKVKAYNINIEKPKKKKETDTDYITVEAFGEYNDELTNDILFNKINRSALNTTYAKAVSIIKDKNIRTKDAYYELCDKDDRLPKDPELTFQLQFTSWTDYFSIPRIYYDLETCKEKINTYLTSYPDLKKHYMDMHHICSELCKLDDMLPPNGLWTDYYKVKDLQNIISLTVPNKRRQRGMIHI